MADWEWTDTTDSEFTDTSDSEWTGETTAITVTDDGAGADNVSNAFAVSVQDTGSAADSLASIMVNIGIQEFGVGQEAPTIYAYLSVSDAAFGNDILAQVAGWSFKYGFGFTYEDLKHAVWIRKYE